jgi:hypothetical protein
MENLVANLVLDDVFMFLENMRLMIPISNLAFGDLQTRRAINIHKAFRYLGIDGEEMWLVESTTSLYEEGRGELFLGDFIPTSNLP